MLALTNDAADVIKNLVESAEEEEVPAETGLRIATGQADEEGTELNISLVEGPEEGDDTIEHSGARVYLSSTASLLLNDKVLDAHTHEDHVHFTIGERE
jgi:iron-sulfur cluster assembly protein